MSDRQLTIADVFNPLESAIKVQQLDEMCTRSRLQAMQMQEYQKTAQAKNDISSMWASLSGQGQSPQQPQQGGSPMQQPQQQQHRPQPQQQGQPQGQQGPDPQKMVQYVVSQAQEAISKGDNESLQKITTWAQNNPVMKPLLDKAGIISINTTGENKQELVVNLDTDEKLKAYIQKYPQAKDVFTKPGTYLVGTDKGILTKAEPHKETETQLHETEIIGTDIPRELRPTNFDPTKSYRVMRDSQGNITRTVGQGRPSFGMLTMKSFVDMSDPNKPIVTMTQQEASQAPKGKYLEANQYEKIGKQASLLGDIRGAVKNAQDILTNNQDVSFSDRQRYQLRQAAHALEPQSALGNLLSGEFGKSLTPAQQDYLVAVKQLAEQSMAMRSVLGAGQSSEMLRGAILSTIPSETTFNREYALKQLKAFTGTLDRLERGIPKIQLRDIKDTSQTAASKTESRTVTRTGKDKSGKKVVQYSDGTIEYAP
jgi:hypothetical protein